MFRFFYLPFKKIIGILIKSLVGDIMDIYLYVLLWTTSLFLAMILQLAAKPKFASRLTGIFIACAVLGGLLIYGYGFTMLLGNIPLAVIRALLAVCGMFVAKMDFSVVQNYGIFQEVGGEFLFWLVHLFALYATASAAITTVGAEALKKLRLFLARWGELNLIFGVNEKSLALCTELIDAGKTSVVFVDDKMDAVHAAAIAKAGCVVRGDEHALQADTAFLRSVGVRRGKRKIALYTLSEDLADNLAYAAKFLKSLEQRDILPEQTSLIIPGQEDSTARNLQVLGERYGYGYVTVFQEANLVARLLVQNYPPCDHISFDSRGKAVENFETLIIGFGQIGQAVLRSLVMNGQFYGSKFRAAVFSPDCHTVNGFFSDSFQGVLENYDIIFHPYDARSREMFEYLRGRGKSTKYVVVCTGSDKLNYQIAQDLNAFFHRIGCKVPVYQCSYSGVKRIDADGYSTNLCKLYHPNVLSMYDVDRMAMILNHYYLNDSPDTAVEDWMRCDYFSRMSSRASADFIGAFLRASGVSAEDAAAGKWDLSKETVENLARTEHLRWCAFHYCMGFMKMSEEEYTSRARTYAMQTVQGEKTRIRIGKNMDAGTHACLVDWDALAALSKRESEITGIDVDYQENNRKNILAVPELLRIRMETEV